MVGIIIVSHSQKLAEGVAELAKMMAADAPVVPAGGLEDGTFGTSFEKISTAIDSVYSDDGAVILMDMGSAVMTAEMVIENMPDRKIRMLDCPLVEGAVVAAIGSSTNQSVEEIAEAVQDAASEKKL
ncbi:dihydroxyacetone kinase phosphoryl donor subunit DhaM [Caproiciproducens sp.]|uniref:dihydroxyacetone kinase phosphoryl donor subunit DhaM n=1 Tax=Caproiciproducens sp. TaxID=1954376 RepID=UPI00289F42BC|nr:dihydroxyacetone kinase phosphoryl donor subunit DhaM [Caproiciproducens sp.]